MDFLQIFAILLTISFLVISFIRPMAIPAIYLVLSNFFVIDLAYSINTSKIYATGLILYFLFNLYKNNQKYSKLGIIYISGIILSIILPSLFHVFIWKSIPVLFLHPLLKALWGLGFFFIPEKYISWQEMFKYLFWGFLISLILITPESLLYYWQKGEGLGRYLVASGNKQLFAGIAKKYWFVMDDNTYENLGILSLPLILHFWKKVAFKSWEKWIPWCLLFSFYLFILYINQYLMPLVLVGINSLIGIIWIIKHKSNITHKRPLILIVCFFSLSGILNCSQFIQRFTIQEKTLQANSLASKLQGSNRISLFLHSFYHSNFQHFTIGVGIPENYYTLKTPFVGGEKILIGHSTFLDFIFSFGLPIGLLSNFIFLFPLIIFLPAKIIKLLDTESKISFFLLFITIFLLAFETIYGRESLQLGVLISFTSIFIITIKQYLKPLDQKH